jgi:hypothetical protein
VERFGASLDFGPEYPILSERLGSVGLNGSLKRTDVTESSITVEDPSPSNDTAHDVIPADKRPAYRFRDPGRYTESRAISRGQEISRPKACCVDSSDGKVLENRELSNTERLVLTLLNSKSMYIGSTWTCPSDWT